MPAQSNRLNGDSAAKAGIWAIQDFLPDFCYSGVFACLRHFPPVRGGISYKRARTLVCRIREGGADGSHRCKTVPNENEAP
ncbi:MAG: hypothetical protein CME06_12140 [Gemmatimonadetes bacterium]|nr:hypothetical protein [Gemmatimonadota bacterium]